MKIQTNVDLDLSSFFVDDIFYSDIEDFLEDYDIYTEDNGLDFGVLDDDWTCKIYFTKLQYMFQLNEQRLFDILYNAHEDRFSDDDEDDGRIIRALKECIDFDKLNSKIPKYYYPTGKPYILTKQELINYCK